MPGYVVDPESGSPRSYRLNGILVFALALIVWGFELTGMPRDRFYRSSVYAVAGGTVVATVLSILAVFRQPPGPSGHPLLALHRPILGQGPASTRGETRPSLSASRDAGLHPRLQGC